MSFASPLFLVGLALVALPILIHLWKRKTARRELFPSLALLMRSRRRVSRKLRLRQLLLLLLRALAVLLIPLALARPYLITEAGPDLPQAVAVILDASFSMGYGSPSSWERAKEEADDILAALGPGDAALLLVADGGGGQRDLVEISYEIDQLRRELRSKNLSHRAATLEDALLDAQNALAAAPQPLRRVVVLTDGTEGAFGKNFSLPWGEGGPRLEIIDVAPESLPNTAILSVFTAAAPEAGPRAFRITARVANFSPVPKEDLPISLEIGDQIVARGFVSIPPGETVEKVFHYTPKEEGASFGAVVLAPDALPEDDRAAFALKAPRDVRALLVNGDPRTIHYEDETFFLQEALAATIDSTSRVRVTSTTPAGLDRQDLSSFDVIALLNVGQLGEGQLAQVRAFVEGGGGLFVSGGDQVAGALQGLAPLLPVKLRDVFVASEEGTFSGGGAPRRLAPAQREHLLFRDFDPTGPGALSLARFDTILLFEPQADEEKKQTLLSFDDGAPALIEGTLGRGKVLVFASTLDRDWTDLPIRPGYVPFVQNLFRYLGGALGGQAQSATRVGEPRTLSIPSGRSAARATLLAPDGAARELLPSAFSQGELRLEDIDRPGIWSLRLLGKNGAVLEEIFFPVALESEESRLVKIDPDTLRALEEESGDGIAREMLGAEATPLGRPLSSYLLFFLLAALFAESVLLARK